MPQAYVLFTFRNILDILQQFCINISSVFDLIFLERFLTRTGIKICNSWDKVFVITWAIGCYTPQKYTLTSVAKGMFTYWARGRGLPFAPPNKMWLYFMSHVAYHLTRWFPKDDRKRMWVKNVFNESKWWFLCKQWALMKIP